MCSDLSMGMFPPLVLVRPSFSLLFFWLGLGLLLPFLVLLRFTDIVVRNLHTYFLQFFVRGLGRWLCGGQEDAIFIEDLNELIRVGF